MVMAIFLSGWMLLAQGDQAADVGPPAPAGEVGAATPGAAAKQAPPPITTLLPFILLGGFLLLMSLRNSSKQQSKLKAMLAGLKKNDRVVFGGGMIGVIVAIKEDAPNEPGEVTLKIDEDNKTRVKVLRSSIQYVLTPAAAEPVKG